MIYTWFSEISNNLVEHNIVDENGEVIVSKIKQSVAEGITIRHNLDVLAISTANLRFMKSVNAQLNAGKEKLENIIKGGAGQ